MDIIEIVKSLFSAQVGEFFAQTSWWIVGIAFVVGAVIEVGPIAAWLVRMIKLLPKPLNTALLVFLNKLAKGIDAEIPDDLKVDLIQKKS